MTTQISQWKNRKCIHAFTLLELIIVVAIIAILASLLIPTLSRVKQKAKGVECIGNQKQIVMRYRLALDDDIGARLDEPSVEAWTDEIGRPGNSWMCPTAPQPSPLRNPRPDGFHGYGTLNSPWWATNSTPIRLENAAPSKMRTNIVRMGGYGFNLWLIPGGSLRGGTFVDASWARQPWFVLESHIEHPSRTPVTGDCIAAVAAPTAADAPPRSLIYGYDWRTDPLGGPGTGQTTFFCIPRHGGRPSRIRDRWPKDAPLPGAINISFFDGHVETVPLKMLWHLRWNRATLPAQVQ